MKNVLILPTKVVNILQILKHVAIKKSFTLFLALAFLAIIDLVTPPANFLSFTFVIIFGSNNNNEKQRREK